MAYWIYAIQAYRADRAALAAAILARQLESQQPLGPAQPVTTLLNHSPPQFRQNPESNHEEADSPLQPAALQSDSGMSAELSTEVVWRPACEHGTESARPAPGEHQVRPEMHGEEAQMEAEYQGKESQAVPQHQHQEAHASRQATGPEGCSADSEALLGPGSACDSPDREWPLLRATPHSPDREQGLLGGLPRSPSRELPLLSEAPHSPSREQPLQGDPTHSPSREQPLLSGTPHSDSRGLSNKGLSPDSPAKDEPFLRGPPHSPDREQHALGATPHSPDRDQSFLSVPPHNTNSHAQASTGLSPAGRGQPPEPKPNLQPVRTLQEGLLQAAAVLQGRSDFVRAGQGTAPGLLHF